MPIKLPIEQLDTRILIIDDDEDDFLITSSYIRNITDKNYLLEWCSEYDLALEAISKNKYDLFFVDYRLGAKNGMDLIKETQALNPNAPIILLTGQGNYNIDVEAMRAGAFDYLIKSELSSEKMGRSIRYALERSASIKAIKASQQKYKSMFEKTKDIVFITNEDFDFLDINDAVECILGQTREDVLKMKLTDLFKSEALVSSPYFQNQLLNELYDQEIIIKHKNGTDKYCTITTSRETDPYGNAYIQGIIHDISNLKRMEKATIQTEKLAATGRLIRTLAHEVRNPLNNISLSIEQLYAETLNEDCNLYLDIIKRNGQRINDLISQLLYTSEPSEITLKKISLQSIIDDVINVALDRITLKHINLHVKYPDDHIYIHADKEKLTIALLNIVINATEAMEANKGFLNIAISNNTHNVQLTIQDNGCGISEENIPKLFEPYFTQKRNGMGLGLVSALNIIQSHKASVEVDSKIQRGTKFMIFFPLINESELQSNTDIN